MMKIAFPLALTFLISGCYSSSMMQTAKPLEKGERQISLGVSGYTAYGDWGVAPDFMYRQGINNVSDWGFGYSMGLFGHFRADWKRQLYANYRKTMFLSTGLGGDLYLPTDFVGDPAFVGVTVPLYFSMNHDGNVIPYFGQRFCLGLRDLGIVEYYGSTEPPGKDVRLYHYMYYSGAFGIRFGERRVKWFAEVSYNVQLEHFYYFYTYQDDSGEHEVLNQGFYRDAGLQLSLGMMINRGDR